jgi:RimJ/RimL family protein N-acetyltransferase
MQSKEDLPHRIVTPRTVVRRTTADDIAQFDAWPGYPWPFECFDINAKARRRGEGRWWTVLDRADACHYSVVLPATKEVIGLHAFFAIDYEKRVIGNMGIRIRADVCDQGYGRESLQPLLEAVLERGFRSIRLDVAGTNYRAIRCYERCGMRIVDEFWQDGQGPDDPNDPEWAPLMPHLRREGNEWFVRFYWMEICANEARHGLGAS